MGWEGGGENGSKRGPCVRSSGEKAIGDIPCTNGDVTALLADKTIRLLFPGTLSINGNVYCSPVGTGSRARRWRSYCSISPQHLARYPSLIAFPRVLRPLACIAASILCNRTPRDLVCPPASPPPPPVPLPTPSSVLPQPLHPPARPAVVTTSVSRDRSALRHSITVRLIRRRK